MRFRILGSSSAGNSALICTEKCKVLLDAGFTGKRMEALLAQAGVQLQEIDAIFITHEHSDHVTGLRGLTRRHPDLRIFANETTARVVQERMPRPLNWQIFENGRPFRFADLAVSPFSIPHDAYDPVGYHFCHQPENGGRRTDINSSSANKSDGHADKSDCRADKGDGNADKSDARDGGSVCWLTDLGYVTEAARRHANACDLLVIEANHDPDMLERCETRSWSTKQRIRGRHGHLSNQAAYDLLAATETPRWRHVCLAHISAECNSLEIVEKQFTALRNGTRNLDIHIFDPASPCPGAEFDLRTPADAFENTEAPAPATTPASTVDTTPKSATMAGATLTNSAEAGTTAADTATANVAAAKARPTSTAPVNTTADKAQTADNTSAVAIRIATTEVTKTAATGTASATVRATSVTQIEIALNF